MSQPTAATTPERVVGDEAHEEPVLGTALRSLPERWQAALWLTDVEGFAPAGTGAWLDASPQLAEQLATRARAGLRDRYLQAHLRLADAGCRDTVERLAAHADGTLPPPEVAKVDEHLEGCSSCADRLATVADVGGALRAGGVEPPAALTRARLATSPDDLTVLVPPPAKRVAGITLTKASTPWLERVTGGAAAAVFSAGVLGAVLLGGGTPVSQAGLAAPAVTSQGLHAGPTQTDTLGDLDGLLRTPEAYALAVAADSSEIAAADVGSAASSTASALGASPTTVAAPAAPAESGGSSAPATPGPSTGGPDEPGVPVGPASPPVPGVDAGVGTGDGGVAVAVDPAPDGCTGVAVDDLAVGCTPAPPEDGVTADTGLLPAIQLPAP